MFSVFFSLHEMSKSIKVEGEKVIKTSRERKINKKMHIHYHRQISFSRKMKSQKTLNTLYSM